MYLLHGKYIKLRDKLTVKLGSRLKLILIPKHAFYTVLHNINKTIFIKRRTVC